MLVRTKGTKITAGQMKELHKDCAPLKVFAGGKTFAFVDFEEAEPLNFTLKPIELEWLTSDGYSGPRNQDNRLRYTLS